jgi:hypothetical protein
MGGTDAMPPHRTNIYLEDDQLNTLKVLAAVRGSSVATIVREATDIYLLQCMREDTSWRAEIHNLLDRVHSRIPPSITPEEIETDITAARKEYREMVRASRR